jgi:hypothetical protein
MSLVQPLRAMSGLLENLPGVADAFRRFRAAYKRVKPALEAPGGMAATLRMAPELASNLDRWMDEKGATSIIAVRAHLSSRYCVVTYLTAVARAWTVFRLLHRR